MSGLIARRLWWFGAEWSCNIYCFQDSLDDVWSISSGGILKCTGWWQTKRYKRLIFRLEKPLDWCYVYTSITLLVNTPFIHFFPIYIKIKHLLLSFHRFYSSPYSISTNRMIAQTSITPFIAASPVSTYQVGGACLRPAGLGCVFVRATSEIVCLLKVWNGLDIWAAETIFIFFSNSSSPHPRSSLWCLLLLAYPDLAKQLMFLVKQTSRMSIQSRLVAVNILNSSLV